MTAGDFLAIAGLLAAFVGLPGSIMVFMIKGLRDEHATTRTDLAFYRRETQQELAAIRSRIDDVERDKVEQKDWVRVATGQMNRMNRMSEQIAELGGKLDATMSVGAGIARIATAIERQGDGNSE